MCCFCRWHSRVLQKVKMFSLKKARTMRIPFKLGDVFFSRSSRNLPHMRAIPSDLGREQARRCFASQIFRDCPFGTRNISSRSERSGRSSGRDKIHKQETKDEKKIEKENFESRAGQS